ncbi:hypothetical protein [Phormidium sp. CCY1219]|uniref:hypothetical protein n=1 Tax=Phormidium sp. CCY1219 TaxID=2886104 RepID=UPI002D1F25E7|nr:hypothetical protein [Phormidium sp. CCY1219]MEB3829494.1 hypothetical protein [Phormidium sp. CCY1219]
MNTPEDILILKPRNRWMGLGLGLFYLISACVAFVVNSLDTALIWVALTSPFLTIADGLSAKIEISDRAIVRRSPLSPRISIPWRKVTRVMLVRNRGDRRLVYVRSQSPVICTICFTSHQQNFRAGLLRLFQFVEFYEIDLQIQGLSPRHDWEQWARQS